MTRPDPTRHAGRSDPCPSLRPSELGTRKSDTSSDVSSDVSDFLVLVARTTPSTKKSVRVVTALSAKHAISGVSKRPANVQHYICWKFAGRLLNRVNTPLYSVFTTKQSTSKHRAIRAHVGHVNFECICWMLAR